jgi:hypothetical protein
VQRLLTWLTSEENTHVTGQMIFIDGGADASIPGAETSGWSRRRRPSGSPGWHNSSPDRLLPNSPTPNLTSDEHAEVPQDRAPIAFP